MHVLVTGANGFIGRHLVRALLSNPALADSLESSACITRVIAADRSAPESASDDPRLDARAGDIADPAFVRSLFSEKIRLVFHLAGIVSGAAEADFDAGFGTNLDGTRLVLEACRHLPTPVRLVFSSSIAVFGHPLPPIILDSTTPAPTLSYGTAKVIAEYLIDDYSRRGFLDGRSIRFSGVVVRPRLPNGALSAFNSDLIRETLAGRPIVSPVTAKARIWVQSIETAVRNLLHAATLPGATWGSHRAITLPTVSVTITEILNAVCRVCSKDVWPLVTFAPDVAIEPMFGRWPTDHPAERARAMGFSCDESIEAIVRKYQQPQLA